jgi:hypothetical protein
MSTDAASNDGDEDDYFFQNDPDPAVMITDPASNDGEEDDRNDLSVDKEIRQLPPIYSKLNVALLNVLFVLVACVTAIRLTHLNYNTVAVIDWILVGGITESSFTFRIRLNGEEGERLVVSNLSLEVYNSEHSAIVLDQALPSGWGDNLEHSWDSSADEMSAPLTESITLRDLESSQTYYYQRVTQSGEISRRGRVRTAPPLGKRSKFKFATAGCSNSGSQHRVFSEIEREEDLLFFLHLGDFHYENINVENVVTRMEAIDRVMGSPTQAGLYSSTGACMIWDDHDWLGNGSHGYEKGREAALASYRLAFPHYELSSADEAVYQAFTIGTVRFIISDVRSESTESSVYSLEQKAWLFNEIAQADQYDFVVWVTPTPWVGEDEPGYDSWWGRPDERKELSNFISQQLASKQNLLAISADAHMLAFDDGSHTYYGDDDTATMSFPILQSGPLDRLGSVKGGPFSEGCTTIYFERNHQYSVVEFLPEDEPCLEIKSYRITGNSKEEIFSRKLCGQIFSSQENAVEGDCDAPWFSTTDRALGITALSMLVIVFIESCFLGVRVWEAVFISAVVAVCFGISILATLKIRAFMGYAAMHTIGFLHVGTMVLFLGSWAFYLRRARAIQP